jgi:hypothetical protein
MTKTAYLIRHAQKDDLGTLTDLGRKQATELRPQLPHFVKIISSESKRVQETALLATGVQPVVDARAGFYMATPEKSDLLNKIAKENNISFLEAVVKLNDPEVLAGVDAKATELNTLINETLATINDGESALIASHDLSISPAMRQRGIPLESIPFLCGYTIDEKGNIQTFNRN